MATRQIKFNAFMRPASIHTGAWRYPGAWPDMNFNFAHIKEAIQKLEAAKFDAFFMADHMAVLNMPMDALKRSHTSTSFEPFTLLSALSGATERIGLVATASTTFDEPYHIARRFASLDHISGGRAGWNLVTSSQQAEALNFNRDIHYRHGERYDRAREFAQVVVGLWDSWDDDAFVRDKASGQMFIPDKMHALDHKGQHFSVRGPLNIQRPPQGHPVIVQAGGSDDMMAVAAEFAEVIFCVPLTLEAGQAFYRDLKTRAARYGRAPDHIKIMPGLSAVIGRTEAEANEQYEYLQSLIHPIVAREILSTIFAGYDFARHPLDGPMPDVPPNEGSLATQQQIMAMARRENLTLLQTAMRAAGARGKSVIKGTPEQVADYIETWFVNEACDGFNIMPPFLPGAFDDFVELVIPELQRRGLFRTDYEGRTLREHLGLPRPVSRYAKPAEERAGAA
jgi:FMN-dependent oxidoreductase (nitrilotriacetate monooxygenase family)